MKVKCKVCGHWFEDSDVYCDYCASKYGSVKSQYDDAQLFKNTAVEKGNEKRSTAKKEVLKPFQNDKKEQDYDNDYDDATPKRNKTTLKRASKKPAKGLFRSIIFFIVFINIISGIIRDSDLGNFFNDVKEEFENEAVYEEEAVPISEMFEENGSWDFNGSVSPVIDIPTGIFEGTLFSTTALDFDNKILRFNATGNDNNGVYEWPIYATVSEISDDDTFYFDVWDQSSLKMLGTYEIAFNDFINDESTFNGEPLQTFYDDDRTVDLTGQVNDVFLSGRLALPYTIENDLAYFEFDLAKINDDPLPLVSQTYIENEYYESFASDDGEILLEIYTYDEPQGYPHISMYYDGVFVLSDGDAYYPPMPFYLNDDQLFATFDHMDTEALTVRESDFEDCMYYDDVDTQLYMYHPTKESNVLYTLDLEAAVFTVDDTLQLKGSYRIYETPDEPSISKDFVLKAIE